MEEYSRIHGRKTEFWQDRGRDYLIPEVRQEVLDYIAEMLERYDLHGLELDFQRQFNCFPPGHEEEGRQVMLDFVKEAFLMEKENQQAIGLQCKVVIDGYTDFIFLNRDGGTFYHGSLNKTIRRIIRDCNLEVLEKKLAAAGFESAGRLQVGSAIGAHAGPGVYGILFVTK